MRRILVAAVGLCAGCVLGPKSTSDAGAIDAGSQTVGDQCVAIFTELCTQAINRCGMIGFSLADCIASNMPTCCSGSACSATSLSPATAVDSCKNQIDVEECNFIANSATPPACQGVPRKP